MEKRAKQVPTAAEMKQIIEMRRSGLTYNQIDAEMRKRGNKGFKSSWRLLREGLVEQALKAAPAPVAVPPKPEASPSPPAAEVPKHARTVGRRRGDRVAQGIADLVTTIVETTLANGHAGAARVAHAS